MTTDRFDGKGPRPLVFGAQQRNRGPRRPRCVFSAHSRGRDMSWDRRDGCGKDGRNADGSLQVPRRRLFHRRLFSIEADVGRPEANCATRRIGRSRGSGAIHALALFKHCLIEWPFGHPGGRGPPSDDFDPQSSGR